jgi:aarF domain-containing kinase
MQTDPNWANFLYDQQNDKIQLIDFGASREYTKEFMDGWFRLLKAALEGDREIMRVESQNLGYLTGEENDVSGTLIYIPWFYRSSHFLCSWLF